MPIHIYLLFPKEPFEIRGLLGQVPLSVGVESGIVSKRQSSFQPMEGAKIPYCGVLVCEGGMGFYIVCSVSYIIYAL